jgi:hypothetical protein
MGSHKETGIEELRRIVAAANWAREAAFDGFTAEECVRLVRACWGSKWDILPDELLHEERLEAAKTGKLSAECEDRLDRDLGGKSEDERDEDEHAYDVRVRFDTGEVAHASFQASDAAGARLAAERFWSLRDWIAEAAEQGVDASKARAFEIMDAVLAGVEPMDGGKEHGDG